jgi:hypothetical protein
MGGRGSLLIGSQALPARGADAAVYTMAREAPFGIIHPLGPPKRK